MYRARDTRLGRDVALKVLPSRLTEDHAAVERFTREARAVSALNHPHIVTIHDTGESEAGRFIVMELVDGRTLRAILGESVSLDALVSWGGQIAKALEVAHAAGITHRDIKPENIMVRDDGYVKVLDFGLARLIPISSDMEAGTLANTTPGTLLGTVRYMSPEQARGDIVTNATDIFARGCGLARARWRRRCRR